MGKSNGNGGNGDLSHVPPQLRATLWKPGQSGNPKGRPKQPSFETVMRGKLEALIPGTEQTTRERLAEVLIEECLKGNVPMIKEILAREWPAVTAHALIGDVEIRRGDAREELARRMARLFPGDDDEPAEGPDA